MTVPRSLRLGVISLHTDPFASPGSGDVGGMNVVVRHTCEALARQGHGVEVFTRWSDPAAPQYEERAGVVIHRLEVGPVRSIPKGEHELHMAEFARQLALAARFDLLHSHHWFSGMAAVPVAREWGVPHVQSFHSIAAPESTELAEGERPESPGRLQGEAFLASVSDRVVAVSNAEARTAVERLKAAPARLRVIHPGVDSVAFAPRGVGSEGRPTVLVAARLEPLKGVDLAISMLAELPVDTRPLLQVAGGPSADLDFVDSLTELARELGVGDDVAFLGPRNRGQLAELMRAASLVLVPSHSETYGLVALEAAASGVPVVAGAVGGLNEAVRDGVTGVLLPTRDPAAWADVVARLLADPAERARLGAAGREYALGRSWDSVALSLATVYREALARP